VRGAESRPGQDALIEIPSKYWAESIAKLKPVKVYTHRVNVAVVFRIHDNMEEGKYILIPISSYLPQNGVDGFEFTPNPQKGGLFFSGEMYSISKGRPVRRNTTRSGPRRLSIALLMYLSIPASPPRCS